MQDATGRSTEEFVLALRAARLRSTAPRLAVLAALQRHPHADADTVIGLARDELGSVSSQAVYNVLATLVEAGLVRRIEPAGSAALYELRVARQPPPRRVPGVRRHGGRRLRRGWRPCLTPAETHGFVLDEAEVTFWGLCPTCQSSAIRPSIREPE